MKIREQFVTNIKPRFNQMDLFFKFLTKEFIERTYPTKVYIKITFQASGYQKPTEYWSFTVYPGSFDGKKILPKYKKWIQNLQQVSNNYL